MEYYIKTKGDKQFLEGFKMNNVTYGVRQRPWENVEPAFAVGKYFIYTAHINTADFEIVYEPKYCDDELKAWFRQHDDNSLFNEHEKKEYAKDMQKKYFMEGFKAAVNLMAESQFEKYYEKYNV